MNRLQRTMVIVCAMTPVFANLAGATIVTFEFSGTIENVYDKSSRIEGIEKGTDFRGSYWIDTEKIKEIQNSLRGNSSYSYRLFSGDENAFGMTVTLGQRVFTSGSKQDARMTSYSSGKNESFSLYAYADTANSNSMNYLALSFSGKQNALRLESDPLLLDGVDVADKNVSAAMTYLDYARSDNGRNCSYSYATGGLGSFAGTGGGGAVPEPGTLAILVCGGGALLYRHNRKNQAVRI